MVRQQRMNRKPLIIHLLLDNEPLRGFVFADEVHKLSL